MYVYIYTYEYYFILVQKNPQNIQRTLNILNKKSNNVIEKMGQGFPGGSVVKNPPANAGDIGSTSAPRRSHMLWGN